MKTNSPVVSKTTIMIDKAKTRFADEVKERSGVNFNLCWHCQSCAGGCPFVHAMDYPPNRVIRLIQLGLKKQALESSGIWICVGCNTCSIQCPNAIDIPAVNDTLRQMAIEESSVIAEPNILHFHQSVLQSIERYGRTHKLEVMLRYKLKKQDWFTDIAVGLKMFIKRKLDLRPSKSTDIKDIRRLFARRTEV
jgi:heterodisulfide reductase subunit C